MNVTDHVREQMVLGWGAVLCCMVAAKTFAGLLAARFFLGALEASVGRFRLSSHVRHSSINHCLIKLRLSLQLLRCGGGEANRQTG